jgi:sarcosine oxidase subunit beta
VETAEAVVIGGGIVGTSIAHYLALKGLKGVVLLERESIASGATGKTGGLVRMHYTNPWEALLALRSREVFANWGELIGGDCGFRRTGFLCVVAPHDVENLRRNVEMLKRVGVRTEVLTPSGMKELQPFCSIADVGAVAYEPESGCADGYMAATSMAQRARELGVSVRQEVTVKAVRVRGDRVVGVETDKGDIEAPVVVIAAGPWSAPLARTAGVDLPVSGMKLIAGVLERPPELEEPHMVFIDLVQGMYFRPDVGNLTRGGLSNVLISSLPQPPVEDPDNYDADVPFQWKVESAIRLARRIPAMINGRWRLTWTGVDGRSPDGRMVLDRAPGVEGLYIAAGFSGTGFKVGPAVGMCMAEFILEGQAKTVDIRVFRMGRFQEGKPLVGEYEYTIPPFRPFGIELEA